VRGHRPVGSKLRLARIRTAAAVLFFGAPVWAGLTMWAFFELIGDAGKAWVLAMPGFGPILVVLLILVLFGGPAVFLWFEARHEDRVEGVLRRVHRLQRVGLGVDGGPADAAGRSMYSLRVSSRGLPAAVKLGVQRLPGFDLRTGDSEFDARVRVGGPERETLAMLSAEHRAELLRFFDELPAARIEDGSIWLDLSRRTPPDEVVSACHRMVALAEAVALTPAALERADGARGQLSLSENEPEAGRLSPAGERGSLSEPEDAP